MISTEHWTEFYRRFQPFCAMARQYGYFPEQVDDIEQAFWNMCPFPHSYKEEYKKKVKSNVSDF